MSVALTSGCNYSLKPTSVRCTRRQIVIPASNGTSFTPSQTAQFFVPSLKNNVMDGASGYLRLTVTTTCTAGGYFDNNAGSLIDRIMTYGAGGQLISDIQNYSVLNAMMVDLQLTQSEKIGLSSLFGTEDDYLTSTVGAGTIKPVTAYADVAAINAATLPAAAAATTITNSNRKGRAFANNTSYTFCIPIIHPLFTMSEKYFPSFALNDDTRIEFTWNSAKGALVAGDANAFSFTITNPEIVVDYIEFDSSVFPMIQATYTGSDLVLPAQDYRHYASIIASGTTGSISQIMPMKQNSARAVFFAFRPAETQDDQTYTASSRHNPFFTAGDWLALNIGGIRVPQTGVRTRVTGEFSQWMASTQTALHAFNSLEMDGGINRTYYNVSGSQAGHTVGRNAYTNAFCVGINLDQLRGQNQTTNSGLSLANVTTYYEGYIGALSQGTGPANENVSVSAYLLHDILLIIDPSGNMSLRS